MVGDKNSRCARFLVLLRVGVADTGGLSSLFLVFLGVTSGVEGVDDFFPGDLPLPPATEIKLNYVHFWHTGWLGAGRGVVLLFFIWCHECTEDAQKHQWNDNKDNQTLDISGSNSNKANINMLGCCFSCLWHVCAQIVRLITDLTTTNVQFETFHFSFFNCHFGISLGDTEHSAAHPCRFRRTD